MRIHSFDAYVLNEGRDDINPYFKAAEEAQRKDQISKLSKLLDMRAEMDKGQEKMFTFHHDLDDCDVTVYYDSDSHCVVMSQDYKNDKTQVAPDDDDISLEGFKSYILGPKLKKRYI